MELGLSLSLGLDGDGDDNGKRRGGGGGGGGADPALAARKLDLLPLSLAFRPPPATSSSSSQLGFLCPGGELAAAAARYDGNRFPAAAAAEGDHEQAPVSPNESGTSSLPLDLTAGIDGDVVAAAAAGETERTSSRASDDEAENGGGLARKKLRLTREQSAFLEESFKEQNTLNPKQKLALAKQLNLRPRQVEVWFQNRRARTKLKQTEVDCEYLKRCCETLTEENRRLQKELSELRALKSVAAAAHPLLSGHLPATTLSMCPSCERVSSSGGASSVVAAASGSPSPPPAWPRFFPFIPRSAMATTTTSSPAT